jgi:glycosyltransferase involved in cell wall biosynthesis
MSSHRPPRIVSVIIGTRNRPDTLRAALASIRALEGPDLAFEILVGDNGTTPETERVVAEFGCIYDRTDVYGCPAARNLAMKRATGEFVAFLDDDDVWLPEHIRPHIAFLDANPDYQAVFGQIVSTDENLNPTGQPWPQTLPADGDVFPVMMSGYFPQVGGTVVRREMLEKYGLMDESLIGDSDWDWQLRIAANHKIGLVQVPCVLFRQRRKGTFDKLQMTRVGYTRRIFFRHAKPQRKRWKTTIDMWRAYFGSVEIYYNYFLEVAQDRGLRGERWGAVKAIGFAFRILPVRAVRSLARPGQMRTAVGLALSPKSAAGAERPAG